MAPNLPSKLLTSHEPRSTIALLEPYERSYADESTAIALWYNDVTFELANGPDLLLVDVRDSDTLLCLGYTHIKFLTREGATVGMLQLKPLTKTAHARM